MFTLLGKIDPFIKWKNKIEKLEFSTNKFEIELYNRHKAQICDLEINLGITASQVINYLKTEFLLQEDSSVYKTLLSYLNAVKEASQNGIIDESLMSGDFEPQRIMSFVKELLQNE